MIDLGVLRDISPRDAWPDEARHLTPWLHDNLDRLAEVIGIPLEAQGSEVAVESFSADILARNPTDDGLVLIENQLETSDHRHLGQILTYAAGLGARTVVWVAPSFREPHLSALKWLNDHTVEGISFFAVRLRVVRIGDSKPAPIFEVVGRPDNWSRELTAVAESGRGTKLLGAFRREFWQHLIDRHPDEGATYPADGASSRWTVIEEADIVIVQFVGRSKVGVYLRGRRGEPAASFWQRMQPYAPALETRLGVPMGADNAEAFFTCRHPANTEDRSTWDGLADWLSEARRRYEAALRDILGATA